MNKLITTALLILALPIAGFSQTGLGGLLEKAGKALGGNQSDVVSGIVNSVIGTKKVDKKDLIGTWSYSSPDIVFESDNLANKAGGQVLASKGRKLLSGVLTRYGVTPGKVKITFKEDNTYICQIGGKTTKGKYTVENSNLTLTAWGKKALKVNAKLSGRELQLAVDADKLLAMATSLGATIGKMNSSVSTLTAFMGNYKGMKIGMKFKK